MEYIFCTLIEKKIRVDMYLSTLFSDFSRSYIQKMIDRGQLKVNWKTITKNIKIENRDLVNLKIVIQKLDDIKAQKMDFDIIYEDDELIVLNKEAWINVHPVPGEWWNENTLVNWLLYHCKNKLSSIWWVERPWIVHRLDKDTSWVIMVAKSDKMMWILSDKIKKRNIWKYYLAIVNWVLTKDNFKIESYIGRDPYDRMKMTTKNPVNPKLAVTYWKVIKHIDNKYSLIMIKLETWRTHQIRVHLSSIWYPIIWDKTYWNSKVNKQVATLFQLKRQALHAYFLDIELYWKKHKFIAELKDDMKRIIRDDIKTEF